MVVNKTPGVRSDGKITADRVLKAARTELEKHGAVKFSLDRVIAKSKVSRSSIYHLFGSRAGVIAYAEATAIVEDVSDGAYLLRDLAEKVETRDQLVFLIEQWLKDAMTPARIKQRARRIANIAASEADDELRRVLREHLHQVSSVWVETYEILQRRKIVSVPNFDLRALAIAVQGMYLGGILVDLYGDDEVAANWTGVVGDMLSKFFGVSQAT